MQPRASVAVVVVAHRAPAPRTEPPDGLFQELIEQHLPLVELLRALRTDHAGVRLSLVVTPPLAALLRDESVVRRLRERFADLPVTADERLTRARDTWEDIGHDLPGAWADLERTGDVELLGSAATHALLPLLTGAPRAVAAQIAVGRRAHLAMFGHCPRGFWLPECAWSPELEPVLASEGVRFVVADAVALEHASPRPLFGLRAPVFTPSGIAVFGRDRAASSDLASGRPLAAPSAGGDPAGRSALFVAACELRALGSGPGSPLAQLEQSLRAARAEDAPHRFVTLADVLIEQPVAQRALPAPSTWHPAGTWEPWVDPSNAWMLRHAQRASLEMSDLARAQPESSGAVQRALEQAARELLLLEASDWAATAGSGGAGRFRAHLARFRRLAAMIRAGVVDETWVSDVGRHDAIPTEVDYRLWA